MISGKWQYGPSKNQKPVEAEHDDVARMKTEERIEYVRQSLNKKAEKSHRAK